MQLFIFLGKNIYKRKIFLMVTYEGDRRQNGEDMDGS